MERALGNGGGLEPKELGIRGEEIAARYLKEAGWTIRGRNVRVGRLELDLIISRGGILAFVEVKTRRGGGFGDPLEAISRKKMRDVAPVRRRVGFLAASDVHPPSPPHPRCLADGVTGKTPYITGFSPDPCLTAHPAWGTLKGAPGPQSESPRIPSGPRR